MSGGVTRPRRAGGREAFLGRAKAMAEIIEKVDDLFEGDLTDDDKLIYVNNVLMGKVLAEQAANNTKEQFAASPDLAWELMDALPPPTPA